MVNKKMVMSKKNLLNIFGILIVVGLLVYVFAAPGAGFVGRPSNVQNFTAVNTTMNISCGNNPGAGLDGENIVNVSFLFNESGGPTSLNGLYNAANLIPNTSTGYTIVYNTSGNQTVFFNGTVLIIGLNDSSRYNITCLFTNLTGWNWTSSANNVSIDTTSPRVESIALANTSNIGNWSGNILINLTANDSVWKSYSKNLNVTIGYANITSVSVNFTNGTSNSTAGIVAINKSASVFTSAVKQPNKEIWWNLTYNISILVEGFHNLCVYANDTNESNKAVANVNGSECIRFLVDIYTPPRVSNFTGFENNSFINDSWVFNVSAWDANVSTVYFNITNDTSTILYANNFTRASVEIGQSYATYWTATINTSKLGDGKYNISVYANDSPAVASYPVNVNETESIQLTIDNTAPSISHTCSPSSTTVGQIVTCTCTGDDGLGGGINSTSDGTSSSTTSSIATSLTPTTAGTFSRTCTAVDKVGHKTAVSASYTITSAGSISGTTSSGPGSTSTSKASIAAGSSATITGFVAGSGVKSINVEVNQAASGVEIQVTKYDSAPTAVSIPKTGTYKYFQVQTQNLVNKLSKATMTIQVEKTWVTTQGIDKSNVALFKYDETAKNWNGLTTTFKSEDTTYYYYTADLTSFSYFAIAPKPVTTTEDGTTDGETAGEEQETATAAGLLNLPYWAWIIIAVVVLGILVGVAAAIKKKRK